MYAYIQSNKNRRKKANEKLLFLTVPFKVISLSSKKYHCVGSTLLLIFSDFILSQKYWPVARPEFVIAVLFMNLSSSGHASSHEHQSIYLCWSVAHWTMDIAGSWIDIGNSPLDIGGVNSHEHQKTNLSWNPDPLLIPLLTSQCHCPSSHALLKATIPAHTNTDKTIIKSTWGPS